MSEAYNVICLFSIVRPKDSYDASKRCLVKKVTLLVPKQLILHTARIQSIVALSRYQFYNFVAHCQTFPPRVRGKCFPLWLWLCHFKDKHKSKVD